MEWTLEQRREYVKEMLISAYPYGITAPQIAEIVPFKVERQTISNYITYYKKNGIEVTDKNTKHQHWYIKPKDYLKNPLELRKSHPWILYLPLRRMVRSNRHQSVAAYTLMQRLITLIDPKIGDQLLGSAAPPKPSPEDDIFYILTDSWANQQWVEIDYKPPNKASTRLLIAPYWFEPAVWSDSAYVICNLAQYDGETKLATLKLDRVQQARQRAETFQHPDPQLILERLTQTWGIWLGDEPVQVKLRFANKQEERLHETRWHPTEKLTKQADGSILWEAEVAEPREMLPWIRGWGADVEVLEPQSIREQIMRDIELTATIYGVCQSDGDDYF